MSYDHYDVGRYYGPLCCSCGVECSGMGRCDDCDGALCFICANTDALRVRPRSYVLCDKCLAARSERDAKENAK